MARRTIIKIDEEKCDGCGLCVPGCAEGAIQIVDGKARLVSETYCDGLGDCLGECPRGALSIEEREAPEFDQQAVNEHLAKTKAGISATLHAKTESLPCGCPGTLSRTLKPTKTTPGSEQAPTSEHAQSALINWPVQLALTPTTAPYFQNADLLIAADCVGFALPDMHARFLPGRTLVVACPKLDDAQAHQDKLAQIIAGNEIKSIHALYMEVPCCSGLVRLVKDALAATGKKVPLKLTQIGINSATLSESTEQPLYQENQR